MSKVTSCTWAVVAFMAIGCSSSEDSTQPPGNTGSDAGIDVQTQVETGPGADAQREADAVVHNETGTSEDAPAEASTGSDGGDAAADGGGDDSGEGDGAPVGTTCTEDKECASNVCHLFPGNGARKCSEACTGPGTCPSGSEGQKCNGEGFCKP